MVEVLRHIREEHGRVTTGVQGMIVMPWWEGHASQEEVMSNSGVFRVLHVYPQGTKHIFTSATGLAPVDGTSWPVAVVWIQGKTENIPTPTQVRGEDHDQEACLGPAVWSGVPKKPRGRRKVSWDVPDEIGRSHGMVWLDPNNSSRKEADWWSVYEGSLGDALAMPTFKAVVEVDEWQALREVAKGKAKFATIRTRRGAGLAPIPATRA